MPAGLALVYWQTLNAQRAVPSIRDGFPALRSGLDSFRPDMPYALKH